jgi:hypothetical protein
MDLQRVESIHYYIHPGERLLWIGRPHAGLKVQALVGGILGLLVLVCLLVLALNNGAYGFSIFAVFFSIPLDSFVVTVLRDASHRRETLYALTTHRALRLSADHLDSVRLCDLFDIICSSGRSNTGTIYCRTRGIGPWPKRNPKGERRSLFRLIADVDYVHQLLLEVQRRPAAPLPKTGEFQPRVPPAWLVRKVEG